MQIDLLGPTYLDEARAVGYQDTVNWYAAPQEVPGQRSQVAYKGRPGITEFATAGTGPIRALHRANKVLYAISSDKAYSVSQAGVATLLGTLSAGGDAQIGHVFTVDSANTVTGYHIGFLSGGKLHVYNTNDGSFAEVTSVDFSKTTSMGYIDNYMAFNGDHRIFICNAGDMLTFTALDFENPAASPDDVVAVFSDHQEIWAMGEESGQIFQNRGSGSGFPLVALQGAPVEYGCGAAQSIAKLDNSIVWLGNDGIVYRANGYTPQRISTHPIEQYIQSGDFSGARAFSHKWKGHWWYYLTLPDHSTPRTYVFDAAAPPGHGWHRAESYTLGRWRGNCHAECYTYQLFGDYSTNQIWRLDDTTFEEGSEPLIAERITQVMHANQDTLYMALLELVFNTGYGKNSGQGSDPVVQVCYSDDFGHTWTSWMDFKLGKTGEYGQRIQIYQLGGNFTNRLMKIRISDPVRRDFVSASARVDSVPLR